MNDREITIAVYVRNKDNIAKFKDMIARLNKPVGFTVKLVMMNPDDAVSACQFYNRVIDSIDARYKIYFDENVVVLNDNILLDVLDMFQADASIGMIGCSGAVTLSTSGLSLTSKKRCGSLLIGASKTLLNWGAGTEVEAIDGMMMATRHDVKWRADLFKSKLFGETAQCVEFKRRGYRIVVAQQTSPWLWYQAENFISNHTEREKFLREYSKDLYPLVQVLIPTFNRPKLFPIALESVLNQTYQNFEIIVSDDSTNEETNEVVQPYFQRDARIKYFRHPGFTMVDNADFLRRCQMEDTRSEYIQWLMDDDVLYPTKFEKMIEVYRNNPDVSLVSSSKHYIDENGKVIRYDHWQLKDDGSQPFLKMNGTQAGKLMFFVDDYIGTLTTVLLKRSSLRDNDICLTAAESGVSAITDVSTHLACLSKGNFFWINEYLSGHRVHPASASESRNTWYLVAGDWAELIRSVWERKLFLTTKEDLRAVTIAWLRRAVRQFDIANKLKYHGEEIVKLEKIFAVMAQSLGNEYVLNNLNMNRRALK